MDLLNGVRTGGAIFNQSFLDGSWAVRFEDGSPLALTVPVHGSAWVTVQGGEPVRLGPGDVAVLCGGTPYVVADDPAIEPDVVNLARRFTALVGQPPMTYLRVASVHVTTAPAGADLTLKGSP
jgi:hypothetical protein